jgi:hypothetical protein
MRSGAAFATAVLLLIAGWALDAFVDGSSPLAPILLCVGVVALFFAALSTPLADRLVWGPLARKLEGQLPSAQGHGEDRTSALQSANQILAELDDCAARLDQWQREAGGAWWLDRFMLPVSEWEMHRGALAGHGALSEAWPAVAEAYREIDRINRLASDLVIEEDNREVGYFTVSTGSAHRSPGETGDDLAGALAAVRRGADALRDLVARMRSWTGQR